MRLGHEERICEFCGGPYIVRRRSNRKTCCRRCSANLIAAKRMARWVNSVIIGRHVVGRRTIGAVVAVE